MISYYDSEEIIKDCSIQVIQIGGYTRIHWWTCDDSEAEIDYSLPIMRHCVVQVLYNSATGEKSVGWWPSVRRYENEY